MRVSDKPFSVGSKYLTLLLCKGARTAPKKKLEKFFSKNLEVSNKPHNFANAFTEKRKLKRKRGL